MCGFFDHSNDRPSEILTRDDNSRPRTGTSGSISSPSISVNNPIRTAILDAQEKPMAWVGNVERNQQKELPVVGVQKESALLGFIPSNRHRVFLLAG